MIRRKSGGKYEEKLKSGEIKKDHKKNIVNKLKDHGGEVVQALEKKIKTGSRSGAVYFFRGRQHHASASGEPPANRSGRLANSFGYKESSNQLSIFSTAFSNAGFPYPKYLEEEKNRPFFVSTIQGQNYKLQKGLQRGVKW